MYPFNSENDNLFSDISPLLTTQDVASCLGVSKPMVRQLVRERHLTPDDYFILGGNACPNCSEFLCGCGGTDGDYVNG